jgi:hypothetical protein
LDALVRSVGGDEGLVRSALPLLEEAGLLARHADLPRALAVYPDFGGASDEFAGEPDPDWDEFARHLGAGGDVDPVRLSQDTGVPLPDLEAILLRFQEHGHLTYRALGGRELLLEILPAPSDTKSRLESTLAHRARGAKERTEAMLAYARDNRCRHGQVARYFGDRWPSLPCGMCDVCAGRPALTPVPSPKFGRGVPGAGSSSASRRTRDDVVTGTPLPNLGEGTGVRAEPPPVDPAKAPLAALQIVHDLASGYRPWAMGKTGLMRALRGTPDAPIKPDRTSAFGALADLKKADVDRLIEA